MKKEKIYECEVKKLHQIAGQKFWKWIRRSASDISRGEIIRCHSCNGKVRLHKQKHLNGPRDHVEHVLRSDSEGCDQGHYFCGESRKSFFPIE